MQNHVLRLAARSAVLACVLIAGAGVLSACQSARPALTETRPGVSSWRDLRVVYTAEPGADAQALGWELGGVHGDLAFSPALTFAPDASDLEPRGPAVWTSPVTQLPGGFTQLLPSWNVEMVRSEGAGSGEGASVEGGAMEDGLDSERLATGDDPASGGGAGFEVSVRDAASGDWSPWLGVGYWGARPESLTTADAYEGGRVAVDVVELNRPADAYRVRVLLERAGEMVPVLRRLVVVASVATRDPTPPRAELPWPAIDLEVPFLAQSDNPRALWSRTCSPTATGMVMAYRGVDRPVLEHAEGVYDPEHDLYGNWGRNIAWAGQHGLTAELARVRGWDQVLDYLRAGQPLVASIRFEKGEFPSYPMEETAGHLVVVRGVTPDGRVILNDPANRKRGEGLIVGRHGLANAWFGHGGVTYVIGPADAAAVAR